MPSPPSVHTTVQSFALPAAPGDYIPVVRPAFVQGRGHLWQRHPARPGAGQSQAGAEGQTVEQLSPGNVH